MSTRPNIGKTLILLVLLVFCLGAAAPAIPLSVKQGKVPELKFGQTYQQLAKPWKLAPWIDDNQPFFLLAHSVVAKSEIIMFDQPFLCRFYFDKPSAQGRLLAIELVHWEKGNSRRVIKAEQEFTKAMLKAYGEQKAKTTQQDKRKIISLNWPGVRFNNQQDEGGQTWYITLTPLERNAPMLAGLPLGKARADLNKTLGLEPYFEPGSLLPAMPGRDYALNLSCSPFALRTYYLFTDYNEKAPLVGVRMLLPQQSVASWLDCRLEQLKQELELKYGKPKTPKANHYVWQNRQARLSLYLVKNQAWVLEFIAANARPPQTSLNAVFPPSTPDIQGYEQLKWNMSPSRALALYPDIAQNALARAGGQGSFFTGQIQVNNIKHQLRLGFGNLGLEEIALSHASPAKASGKQQEELKQMLEKQYGPSDWQHDGADETSYYWSRASGYLEFTVFKEPAPSWRIVFKQRPPMVQ